MQMRTGHPTFLHTPPYRVGLRGLGQTAGTCLSPAGTAMCPTDPTAPVAVVTPAIPVSTSTSGTTASTATTTTTATTTSGSTLSSTLSSLESWLTESTILSSIPNWGVAVGGLVLLMLLGDR